MKPQYYFLIVVSAVGVMLVQRTAFILIWHGMVSYAAHHGRTLRGGVGAGLMFYFGFYFLMFNCFAASIIGGLVRRPGVRWFWVFILAVTWPSLMYLSLSNYPIRIPAFAATGALVLMAGSGFLMPWIGKRLRARPNLQIAPSE